MADEARVIVDQAKTGSPLSRVVLSRLQEAPEGTILLVQGPDLLTGVVGVPLKQPDEIGFGVLQPTPPSPLKHAQQHAQHQLNGPGRQEERELG